MICMHFVWNADIKILFVPKQNQFPLISIQLAPAHKQTL